MSAAWLVFLIAISVIGVALICVGIWWLGRILLSPVEELEAAAYERAFREQRRELNARVAARRIRA